jgi:hypothetical protein
VRRSHIRKPRAGSYGNASRNVQAGTVDRHRHELETCRLEYTAGAEVPRILHPNRVAPVEQEARNEIERLMDARKNEDSVRVTTNSSR